MDSKILIAGFTVMTVVAIGAALFGEQSGPYLAAAFVLLIMGLASAK